MSTRIFGNHYLSADAITGDANDNWTGVVSLRIRCADSHGSTVVSNQFYIIIQNVNDPPIFTSTPLINGMVGLEYVYKVAAVDGDNDPLTFNLAQKPENMTISIGGKITWIPSREGTYAVSVAVGDGQATTYQNVSINVTANHPPRFTSGPVTNATIGIQYLYDVRAIDDENDTLTFSLVTKPNGMSIDSVTGHIAWTPSFSQIGNNSITVELMDGRGGEAEQTFVINVISLASPKCSITSPVNGTKVSGKIMLQGTTIKRGADILNVQVRIDRGNWFSAIGIDNWTNQIDTSILKNGPHTFEVRAFDGANYSDPTSVTLIVNNPLPSVSAGNGLWWILQLAISIIIAVIGILLWRAKRKSGSTFDQS